MSNSDPSPGGPGSSGRSPGPKPEFMEYLKSMAFGLLCHCPMGEALDACVFKEMRKVKQPGDGKLIYQAVCSRSSGELEEMIGRHRKCLMKRECTTKQK